MAFAKPTRASDQVAALTGVTPAARDPGQPVRLALSLPQQDNVRLAAVEAAPAPVPAPVAEQPAPVVEEAVAAPAAPPVQFAAEPQPAPVE
jgi:hypothetical protein